MSNVKKFTLDWNATGLTAYMILRRESDSYRMNASTGAFDIASPTTAGAYNTMTEDGGIKGRYEFLTNAGWTLFNDGRYVSAIYKQIGGSPAPVSDMIIGTGEMDIVSDLEIYPDGSVAAVKTQTDKLTFDGGTPSRVQSTVAYISFTVATDAGNSGNQFKTNLTGVTDGAYIGGWVRFTSGTLMGLPPKRVQSSNGTTGYLYLSSSFVATPANGDAGKIINE